MESKKKINVLVLESRLDLGGAERITYEIMTRMNKEEFDIIFCTLYGPGVIGNMLKNEGYKFYHNIIKTKYDIRGFLKLRRILLENRIQVIYLINQPLTLLWGVILGKAHKIPIVSVIHNTFVTKEQVKLRIYRVLLPFVEKVVAVAMMQKEHMSNYEGVPKDMIKVIYNGIDIPKYSATVDKRAKINSLGMGNYDVVGIVGRLSDVKGIDILLNAAKLILKEKEGTQFVIVGDGPERIRLERLARDLKIHDKVYFLGSRNDINEILPVFDVAVLSSRTEAFPMAILEYMASGKGIVATNVGSIAELIKDGETGFLVEKENPVVLAEKILCLLKYKELASAMGERAKAFVQEKFSVELTVRDTETLLLDVTAKSDRW